MPRRPLAFASCKKRLGGLWFGVAGALAMLLVAQTRAGNVFDGLETEVFGWFLPTVMPTLGLMAAVFVTDAQSPPGTAPRAPVDPFFFWLSLGASGAYLGLVALPLLSPDSAQIRLEAMQGLSVLLAALQGLVSTLLAVFFFKPAAPRAPAPPDDAAAATPRKLRSRPPAGRS